MYSNSFTCCKMSTESEFQKYYSKHDRHESSNFPNVSDHSMDSNIFKCQKTYGRLSMCIKKTFPAFIEESWEDENTESRTSITSSSDNKNYYQKEANSEYCLFSDEGTDYISGSADSLKDRISSPIFEMASSGSNYYHTRKNLKNQSSNEQYDSVVDDNEFYSANDILNLNQATFSVKQSSLLSKNSQAIHTRIDVISSDDPVNVLPQKLSNTSTMRVGRQTIPVFDKALLFEHPLYNQRAFPLKDLVKKNSVNNTEDDASNSPSNKRIKEEYESAPVKKKVASDAINNDNLDAKTPSNSIQEQNVGNFEDLDIHGSSILSFNDSSMENSKYNIEIKPLTDSSALIKKPTTFSFLENPVYHKQKMRPGSLVVSFDSCANNYLQQSKNKCMHKKRDIAKEELLTNAFQREETVSQYFKRPYMTDILFDFLGHCVSTPNTYHDDKKGYDFPENFEKEKIMALLKDFVLYIYNLIIPRGEPIPSHVSYSQIFNAPLSVKENTMVMHIFKSKSTLDNPSLKIKLDDMVSKLFLVALLVIFQEYKSRQTISNIVN